jgi:hypothetical protein
MLHNPALEAQRWKARGSINLERAQWVAAGLRPIHRAERARLLNELTAMGPVNSGISGSTTLSKQ